MIMANPFNFKPKFRFFHQKPLKFYQNLTESSMSLKGCPPGPSAQGVSGGPWSTWFPCMSSKYTGSREMGPVGVKMLRDAPLRAPVKRDGLVCLVTKYY